MSQVRLPRGELAKQLSESLGREKATEVVNATAAHLGLDGDGEGFDQPETLALLDHLAKTPGLVGIVARFAKVRVILRFKK